MVYVIYELVFTKTFFLGQLYAILHREVNTNQRIGFDIDSSDQYVVSGGTDGALKMWNLKSALDDSGNVSIVLRIFTIFKNPNILKC